LIHLEQNGKRNCGQTCVAMLTGMSIDEVCCRMGKKGATHYKDLLDILRESFYLTSIGFCRNEPFSPYAGHVHLCRVRYPHRRYWSHWVIIDNTIVYDPSRTRTLTFRIWLHSLPEGTHITSYVTLTPRAIKMSVHPAIYLEQLQQLAKRVVWDGDLISKSARSALMLEGLVDRSCGYNFITVKGIQYLKSVDLMPDLTQYKLVRK
jgi:hypothetical protein